MVGLVQGRCVHAVPLQIYSEMWCTNIAATLMTENGNLDKKNCLVTVA